MEHILKQTEFCACGCGIEQYPLDSRGRPRRYIRGHVFLLKSNRGNHATNWKGGRCIDGDGYVKIYTPEHPFCDNNGYVREHRLVMEKHLDRYLQRFEDVHHIDGYRQNNDIKNLQLMTHSEHMRLEGILRGGLNPKRMVTYGILEVDSGDRYRKAD